MKKKMTLTQSIENFRSAFRNFLFVFCQESGLFRLVNWLENFIKERPMNSIQKYLVQVSDNDPMLRTKLLNVPLRLYRENKEYKKFILSIVEYMNRILDMKFNDYEKVKGISGANVGIPYNIIIVRHKKGKIVCLNPKITHTGKKVQVKSNCGSILLKESIEVTRVDKVILNWVNLDGKEQTEEYEKTTAYTLQHEVEHNEGILITDKEK